MSPPENPLGALPDGVIRVMPACAWKMHITLLQSLLYRLGMGGLFNRQKWAIKLIYGKKKLTHSRDYNSFFGLFN